MKTRRDKLDDIFSKVIREAHDWCCERCGKQFPEGSNRAALHASHYMSRRHQATRFDPSNVFAHCFSCHQYLGENPAEFYRWVRHLIGDSREQDIKEKAHTIVQRSKIEKAEMYNHYKSEYQRILAARAGGKTGFIKVIGWD